MKKISLVNRKQRYIAFFVIKIKAIYLILIDKYIIIAYFFKY